MRSKAGILFLFLMVSLIPARNASAGWGLAFMQWLESLDPGKLYGFALDVDLACAATSRPTGTQKELDDFRTAERRCKRDVLNQRSFFVISRGFRFRRSHQSRLADSAGSIQKKLRHAREDGRFDILGPRHHDAEQRCGAGAGPLASEALPRRAARHVYATLPQNQERLEDCS